MLFDSILPKIPLPFNSSVGEVLQMVSVELALTSLMCNPEKEDTMVDQVIDHAIAIAVLLVAKKRQQMKN